MDSNWSTNLDMLTQAGVLDFDAPAYILGQPSRNFTKPVNPNPFGAENVVPQFKPQPKGDEFKPEKQDGSIVKNPVWKKWAFGVLALGALVIGGYKAKGLIKKGWIALTNLFKSKPNAPKTTSKLSEMWKSVTSNVKKGWDVTKQTCENWWNKVVNFFSKKKKATP